MTIQFDIKKLAKNMNVKDKATLLVQNIIKKIETDEYILTIEEKKAIIEDARRNNELPYIRKVLSLYDLAFILQAELEIKTYHFISAVDLLERHFACTIIKNRLLDAFENMMYDWLTKEFTVEQLNDPLIQKNIDEQAQNLRIKYHIIGNKFFDQFDHFAPSTEKYSFFLIQSQDNNVEPHPNIQKFFILSVELAKRLKFLFFQLNYILSKTEVDILSDKHKVKIDLFKNTLKDFENLESSLYPLRFFRDLKLNFVKTENLIEPNFFETVKNLTVKLELSEADKLKAKSQIDNML